MTTTIVRKSEIAPSQFFARKSCLQYVREADLELAAPWWDDLVFERIANDMPLPQELLNSYERLNEVLDDLERDDEDGVDMGAVETARLFLNLAMFARVRPPRLTWHGRDAVVIIWQSGRTTTMFTAHGDAISLLQERDGAIVARRDDLPRETWNHAFS